MEHECNSIFQQQCRATNNERSIPNRHDQYNKRKKLPSPYMITEHLLERIEATLASKTSALLVYISIMTKLHIYIKRE